MCRKKRAKEVKSPPLIHHEIARCLEPSASSLSNDSCHSLNGGIERVQKRGKRGGPGCNLADQAWQSSDLAVSASSF